MDEIRPVHQPASGAPEVVLGPATRLLWRSPGEIHLELGNEAVVVAGLPAEVLRRVAAPAPAPTRRPVRGRTDPGGTTHDPRLDHTASTHDAAGSTHDAAGSTHDAAGSTHDAAGSTHDAAGSTHDAPGHVRPALAALRSAGFLWDRTDDPRADHLRPPLPALRGEFASLAVRHGPDAARILRDRRRSCVEVHGASRVVEHLAALLAASGVGRVRCAVSGDVRLFSVLPGGLLPAEEGTVRSEAANAAIRRAAPDCDTTIVLDTRPDLIVIAQDAPVPAERRDALHADGTPHLSIRLGTDHGVIGPFVVPGLTSCLRCADLIRTDRDPAWNALAAQLATPPRYGPASAVALAATIAGVAAGQVLAYLDGDEPTTVDGTLELHLPDWRLRRRSWPVHPHCDCASEM